MDTYLDLSICYFVNLSFFDLRLSPKKTRFVSIISATNVSHSITVVELQKKWDKSEHPKWSHKPVEILAKNTKEMAINRRFFLFWP